MLGLVLAAMFQVTTAAPRPIAIEGCEGGGRRLYFDSTHSPGGAWFSLQGRVLDEGRPVCGASVSVRYVTTGREDAGTLPTGAISPSGLNGEFFLDNIKKGVPFQIVVDPYASLEIRAVRDGLPAARELFEKEKNLRSAGVARYVGAEVRSTDWAGLLSMDINLMSDASAVGVVVGKAETFEGVLPETARVLVAGKAPIDAKVDRRTGRFVAFGVPAGRHTVRCEVLRNGQLFVASRTVTVANASEPPAPVEMKGYLPQ